MRIKIISALLFLIFASYSIAEAHTMKSRDHIITDAQIISSSGKSSSSDYSLSDVQIGNFTGGTARSAGYILEAFPLDEIGRIPNMPVVMPLPPDVTNNPKQLLSGTKDKDSSIYVNGYKLVPLNSETVWNACVTLEEGANSFVITARNSCGLASGGYAVNIFLDTSAPTKPVVTDDGNFTSSLNQLRASWIAEDSQTGIVEYQYAIGTGLCLGDIIEWTTAGITPEINRAGLLLQQGGTYYVSVKARNGAGSWSQIGVSDGIRVNQSIPVITGINPAGGTSAYVDGNVNFKVSAQDEDGDSILCRFLLGPEIIREWQDVLGFNWTTSGLGSGIYLVKAEVSDNNGGEAFVDVELYLFQKPIPPPLN